MAKYDDKNSEDAVIDVLRRHPNSNLAKAFNVYVHPSTTVTGRYDGGGAHGWVDREEPLRANIATFRPSTVAHEAAHVGQNLANQHDILTKTNRGSSAYNQNLQGLGLLLEQLRIKYPELVGANLGDSSREILANLQGIEASLPEGTNVLDSLALPPAYKRLVEQRMFPNSDKLFESNYVKPEGLKSNESIFQYIQRKFK